MDFPAFSEYEDVFSTPLPATTFATYMIPSWMPAPAALLKIAKALYGHWKGRKLGRKGHPIIPTLNVILFFSCAIP
jgi:enhancer of polycomb-like protein